MANDAARVSVVHCQFNYARYLRETLDNIINAQAFRDTNCRLAEGSTNGSSLDVSPRL